MAAGAERPVHHVEASHLHARRERVFLVLAGVFLGTLAMLNILGITRFVKLASFETASGGEIVFAVAVGVLPYPVTFLCTDFISELYGRARANWVVFVGFLLNLWVVAALWLGGVLPGFEAVDPATGEFARDAAGRLPLFFEVRERTFQTVTASMIAYLAAQFCDVWVFHYWKKKTSGRMLWLRNNGSTLVSQFVDTVAVILITYFWARALPVDPEQGIFGQLLLFIATGYAFKAVAALLDTLPFYVGVRFLSGYLEIDPMKEHTEK